MYYPYYRTEASRELYRSSRTVMQDPPIRKSIPLQVDFERIDLNDLCPRNEVFSRIDETVMNRFVANCENYTKSDYAWDFKYQFMTVHIEVAEWTEIDESEFIPDDITKRGMGVSMNIQFNTKDMEEPFDYLSMEVITELYSDIRREIRKI